jgi:hypothetical protein
MVNKRGKDLKKEDKIRIQAKRKMSQENFLDFR